MLYFLIYLSITHFQHHIQNAAIKIKKPINPKIPNLLIVLVVSKLGSSHHLTLLSFAKNRIYIKKEHILYDPWDFEVENMRKNYGENRKRAGKARQDSRGWQARNDQERERETDG